MPIDIKPVIDPSTHSNVAKISITSLAYKNKDNPKENEKVSFFPYDFDYDDSFKPEWNSYDAFGRMDPVMIYKKTSRDITVSFNVVSNSPEQAKQHFSSLQKLINFLYPEYTNGGGPSEPAGIAKSIAGGVITKEQSIINKSPLMKVEFDNLLNNENYIVVITNFKHKLKFDSSSTYRKNNNIVPGEFNISMTFKVLHTSDFQFSDFKRLYGG